MKACDVSWCASTTRGVYCPIHAQRPARPRESREQWERRIRGEDRAAKTAARQAAAADAA